MMTTVTLLTAVTLMFSASTLLVSCSGGGDTPEKVSPTPTPTTPTNPTPDNPTQPDQPTNPDQPTQPDQPTVPTLPENVEIVLNATSSAMSKGSTRATTIDSNTDLQGQNLTIFGYFNDTSTAYLSGVKLHYTGGTPAWEFREGSTTQHYYWPTGNTLDFVGYCPFERSEKAGYITADPTYNYSTGISFSANMVSYMTSTTQSGITEFMCAVLPDQTADTQTAAGGALSLEFKHSFARILFNLSSTTTASVKVNSISMTDLKTSGSCAFNGTTSTWSSQSGSETMTLTEELQRGKTEATAPFLVIPNNYGSKNLSVNVTWTEWDTEKTQTYTAPLTINWEAGSSYTYTLTITKYELLVNVSKFTEQW